MSAISLKSITGITSITTPAGVDNQLTLHTNNTTERVKINSSGNVSIANDLDVDGHTNLDNVSVAGISTFSDHINLPDNKQIKFGGSADFKIEHNTNENYIDSNSGHIYIRANVNDDEGDNIIIQAMSGENSIKAIHDGAVELYHNGDKRFETSSTGATVTGNLFATNKFRGNDNVKLELGTGNDLELFHNGSNTFIRNNTGYMVISSENGSTYYDADNHYFRKDGTGEYMAKFFQDGGVELYYDDSKKLQTTSSGVTVTGTLFADKLQVNDGEHVSLGNDNDLRLYFDGSNSAWNNSTGNNYFYGGGGNFYFRPVNAEQALNVIANGSVELFHDNTKMAYTSSSGFDVTNGDLRSHLNIKVLNDNQKLLIGAGNDLQLYHDGSHSYIDNNTGSLRFRDAGGAEKFRISGSGTQFNDDITLSNDNDKINIGAGNDLQIYSTGGRSYIDHVTGGTGNDLWLRTKTFVVSNYSNNEYMIVGNENGSVNLYHNNSNKLQTQSDGVEILSTGSWHGLEVKHSNGNIVAKLQNKGSGDEGYLALYDSGGAGPSIQMDGEHGRLTCDQIRIGGNNDANQLEDYEEGSWTPTIKSLSGTDPTISYTKQDGRYTKIGNVVHLFCFIDIAAGNFGTNGTGDGVIEGLPYTISNSPSSSDCHGSASDNNKIIPNTFSAQRNNAILKFVNGEGRIRIHQYSTTNPIYQTGWSLTQIDNGNRFKWGWTAQYRTSQS